MTPFHLPIMVAEILDFFQDVKIKRFVDGTLGAGGHSLAILEGHPEIEEHIGIDQDPEAMEFTKRRLELFADKMDFVSGNFADLGAILGNRPCDGMLFDLGVSSMHFDKPERGFSFRFEGPLDMRMDPSGPLTAEVIVNQWSEKAIGEILREYGEVRGWRRQAKSIVEARQKKRLRTTKDLESLLAPNGRGKIHPLTQTFQALRIAVNRELDVLKVMLPAAIDHLTPGGKLGVISFHSLEDRIVKWGFRERKDVEILTKKPIMATREEIKLNPRARSARLRFIKKK